MLLAVSLLQVQAQEQPPELEAIYKRGLQLYEAGKYAEAIPIAEEYVSVAAAKYGEEHQLYATGLGYLGVLYEALNRRSEAESFFKRALSIKEKTLGQRDACALHPYRLGRNPNIKRSGEWRAAAAERLSLARAARGAKLYRDPQRFGDGQSAARSMPAQMPPENSERPIGFSLHNEATARRKHA